MQRSIRLISLCTTFTLFKVETELSFTVNTALTETVQQRKIISPSSSKNWFWFRVISILCLNIRLKLVFFSHKENKHYYKSRDNTENQQELVDLYVLHHI